MSQTFLNISATRKICLKKNEWKRLFTGSDAFCKMGKRRLNVFCFLFDGSATVERQTSPNQEQYANKQGDFAGQQKKHAGYLHMQNP